MAQEKSKVWYKEPWPWLLFSGPAIVVVAAFVTLYLAASGSSDLVSDDYYKDGKHINLQLERDVEAAKRGIVAQGRRPGGQAGQSSAPAPPAPGIKARHQKQERI